MFPRFVHTGLASVLAASVLGCGTLVGELVDLATGAAWEFDPSYIKATLTPVNP